MSANMPSVTLEISKHRAQSFGFATIALALLMLIAPTSRAQQAPPPVAQPAPANAAAAQTYKPVEGDFIAHDFHFKSGETLPELHLHYRTLGTPTRDAADRWLQDVMKRETETLDANDLLYAVNASRNYDPSAGLEKISVAVMFVNSADDFINPPELGIAEREIKKVKNGTYVLLPLSEQTHGHGTHTWAALWQQYLKELLDESQPPAAPAAK